MATKLFVFLSLLAFQEMATMLGEAALCSAPSGLFHGLCFRNKNCDAICQEEGFTNGHCRFAKCKCTKDCGTGGGPREGPPVEDPPEQGPPGGGEGPPEQGPPGGDEGPPEEGPSGSGEGQLSKVGAGGRKMMPAIDNKF